jgi:aldehyde dehydrogenase (NAD(P)+)
MLEVHVRRWGGPGAGWPGRPDGGINRGGMTMGQALLTPAWTESLDRSVADLVAGKGRWARLPIAGKAAYLEAVRRRTLGVMDEWVAGARDIAGVPAGSHWAGPEWGAGPWYLLLAVVGLQETLAVLERGRAPTPAAVWRRSDGTTVARVFPASGLDRLMATSAEVWMQPGVTPESLPATMAPIYRQASSEGGVAVVLGAGNLTVAGLSDVLHQLYLEGRVAVLKTSPVQAPLDDVVAHILAPLVEDGYVRIATGGGQVGAYLVDHPGVDAVHLTGGRATHDAIVFGIGADGARRKAANQPRLTKPVTSELGGVGPVIVVPGPWTRRDVTTQAEKIVSMALYTAGHTCISAQVLVLPAGWPTSQALLDEIEHQMRRIPPRDVFYPGTADRHRQLIERHPSAIELHPQLRVPWTLVWDLDPAAEDEVCFTEELFGPFLTATRLPAPSPASYLHAAVDFVDTRLTGTLAACLLIHPATARRLAPELDAAVERLRYGTIGVNEWPGVASFFPACPWGGAPGAPLNDIQSGFGFVHNTLMFARPHKTVARNSFHPMSRAWRHRQWQTLPHPLYSVTHPYGDETGRRYTRLAAEPSWRHVPGILAASARTT